MELFRKLCANSDPLNLYTGLTELMNEEVLTHMEKDNSHNDLEKMFKSVEALRVIKRSVTRKGGQLRQLATEGPSQDAEDDEDMTLDEIAAAIADPAVPRDQLLAALGKGGGKGAASGTRPFRFTPKPGAKTSSKQQFQQQQQQVGPHRQERRRQVRAQRHAGV